MMIEFARIWALFLLPLPLAAWFLLPLLPERRALRVPASVWHWMTALSGAAADGRRGELRRLGLRSLGWLALVLALAGPQTKGEALLLPTGRDLLVAVDLSASMAEQDILQDSRRTQRIAVARELVGGFIAARHGDRVGLIAFASDAFLIAPLTFDTGAVAQMLEELVIGLPGRKTDLGQAVGLAVQALKDEPPAERILIILSDGETNSGGLSALDAAALASDLGLTIHLIGFAGEIESENARFMEDIAGRTGGRYFFAGTPDALSQVIAEIDRLAPASADSERPRLVDQWSWIPLILALAALTLLSWRELREA